MAQRRTMFWSLTFPCPLRRGNFHESHFEEERTTYDSHFEEGGSLKVSWGM